MNKITAFLVSMAIAGLTSCAVQSAQGRHLQYSGHEVHYEVYGNSPKTLFFIHGWTGSTRTWKYQLEEFGGYKVIAVDLPGNGKSSKNENARYTMELFADCVREVAKKEKVTRAFFFGHSMGFAVVEVIAAKYPELCAGLVCIDGLHFELPEDQAAKEQWVQYNRDFARSLETEKGREDFINALFLPDTPRRLKDEVLTMSRSVPLAIGKAMIEGVIIDQKYWAKKQVQIPCLAVYSPVYGSTPQYRSDFLKTYPQTEYHDLSGVSHFFMLEIPYRTNQLIDDFLSKHYR